MFDDQLAHPNTPPNLPVEPDDMFAGVEKDATSADVAVVPNVPNALDAGLLKKKDQAAAPSPLAEQNLYEMKQPILGRILMFVLVAIVLGGVGFGGWYVYDKFIKTPVKTLALPIETPNTAAVQPIPEVNTPVTEVAPVVTAPVSTTAEVTNGMNNDKILFGQTADSDKDGLDDVREKELGTDPNNPDTDGDGLSDGDEVLIWKTNPLNPDTDGDGFKDGDEVKHGYNPLGPGKLFSSQTSTSTASSTTTSTIK